MWGPAVCGGSRSFVRAGRGLEYVEFRGNVDTRLRKLSEGQVDAAVLAAAGLDRLGRTEWVRERFSADVLCPAPGQGALAIECRAADERTRAVLASLDHAESRFAVTAERVALAALGGGCQVPIGAYCRREGEHIVTYIESVDVSHRRMAPRCCARRCAGTDAPEPGCGAGGLRCCGRARCSCWRSRESSEARQ